MADAHASQVLIACLTAVLCTAAAPGAHDAAPAHHPRIDRSGRPRSGQASYYGGQAAGRRTAAGGAFAPGKMTAASRTLPLGTKAKVTNAATGKSVKVTVTDRGPFAKNRIIDVSSKAAGRLGMKHDGVAQVRVQPLHAPPQHH